jgi:hypothetical protein
MQATVPLLQAAAVAIRQHLVQLRHILGQDSGLHCVRVHFEHLKHHPWARCLLLACSINGAAGACHACDDLLASFASNTALTRSGLQWCRFALREGAF